MYKLTITYLGKLYIYIYYNVVCCFYFSNGLSVAVLTCQQLSIVTPTIILIVTAISIEIKLKVLCYCSTLLSYSVFLNNHDLFTKLFSRGLIEKCETNSLKRKGVPLNFIV